MQLKGKRAIVTGGSRGLGFAIAKQFVLEGADVAICARNSDELGTAVRHLESLRAGAKVYARAIDASNKEAVEQFVNGAVGTLGSLDIVVANAGMYGPMGKLEEVDWEEWAYTIDVNLKGPALLCKYAIPHLKKNTGGRIILLSGGGATKPLPFISGYAASKAAVVRFGETLAQELISYQIDVNCIAPGACNTKMLDEVLDAGPEKVGEAYYKQALKQKETGGESFENAANLCAFLGSEQSRGITGKLISAVWDPWKDLTAHKNDLSKTDVYTLRRIIPEERNLSWGGPK